MSDPPRLVEQHGLAGSLVRAGAEEQPSRDAIRKVAVAMGAGAAVLSSSTAATGATAGMATGAAGSIVSKGGAPLTLAVVTKWIGVGTLSGLVTVTAATQVDRLQSRGVDIHATAIDHHAGPAGTLSTPPRSAATMTTVQPPVLPLPAVSPVDDPVRPPSPSPRSAEPVRSGSETERGWEKRGAHDPEPVAGASAETSPVHQGARPAHEVPLALAPEIAFVDRAWQAVQQGSYERALADLEPYEVRFPELRLHPEVLFVRMEAESHLGHSASAVSLARQIVSIYPKSAQAARARTLLLSR